MNWATIAKDIGSVLNIVEEFAPVGAALGPEGAAAAAIAEKAAAFGQEVLTAATNAGAVIATGDLATIQKAADDLQTKNDAISEQVAAS